MFNTVAVVGATGAVGRIILQLLQERKFPAKNFRFLASARSAGQKVEFNGSTITVEELTFAEIAEALGLSQNTVASRYRYAMEKLQRSLEPLIK